MIYAHFKAKIATQPCKFPNVCRCSTNENYTIKNGGERVNKPVSLLLSLYFVFLFLFLYFSREVGQSLSSCEKLRLYIGIYILPKAIIKKS